MRGGVRGDGIFVGGFTIILCECFIVSAMAPAVVLTQQFPLR